jgi:hypothetical protein
VNTIKINEKTTALSKELTLKGMVDFAKKNKIKFMDNTPAESAP